jgi:hypothetical protein
MLTTRNLTDRIGSAISADVETLLSGAASQTIRTLTSTHKIEPPCTIPRPTFRDSHFLEG